jgi:hypothetical protein
MPLSWIIAAPYSDMALPKIMSNGHLIQTARLKVRLIRRARNTDHGCSNAPNAAPSAKPARRASIADSYRRDRRGTSSRELGLVDGSRRVKSDIDDPIVRAQWHGMLAYIAAERGYARGWVAHTYRKKFGTWPAWGAVAQPIPPSPEVRSWVRHRLIAFAKARGTG